MKYNAICRVIDCGRWMREDDVVCLHHWRMIPQDERWRLWRPHNPASIHLVLELLTEMEQDHG